MVLQELHWLTHLPSLLPPSLSLFSSLPASSSLLPLLSSLLPPTFLYSPIFSHSPPLISGHPPHCSLSARLNHVCGSRLVLCGQLLLTSPVRTSTSHLCSAPVLPGTTDDHLLSLPPSLALTHAYGQRFSLLPEDKALCSGSPGGE